MSISLPPLLIDVSIAIGASLESPGKELGRTSDGPLIEEVHFNLAGAALHVISVEVEGVERERGIHCFRCNAPPVLGPGKLSPHVNNVTARRYLRFTGQRAVIYSK